MTAYAKFEKLAKKNNVAYVDFRFTDLRGRWHHTCYHIDAVDKSLMEKGLMIDGSSIDGWKSIENSDMLLMPDPSTAVMDPFAAQPQIIVFCDVFEPEDGSPYARDPRSIARKAEAYLKSSKIADQAFFGPEPEFFVFDNVRFKADMHESFYHIDAEEGPYNSGRDYPQGNSGYRPGIKGGYFPVPPVDSLSDLRAEMMTVLGDMGVGVEKHHHEVAPSQNELGFNFSTLLNTADNLQKYKYVVHNVANVYGKTATFMAKPIYGDNGSGMHVHLSLAKAGKSLFSGNQYSSLSETALFYIGGILKHARALNAFTNPTTNSYKRLLPGYEAPVLLAYAYRNRSAAIRVPHVTNKKAVRFEARFPDPTANPYLAFAALLMAGIDGIKNKIHPGEAMDKNLYALTPKELSKIRNVAPNLREALWELRKDCDFLMAGDVFTEDMIESYIALKEEEATMLDHHPHPAEFSMYYSI